MSAPVTPAAKAAQPSIVEYDFTDFSDDSGARQHEIEPATADEVEAEAKQAKVTDWVELAKVQPIVCMGQIPADQRRVLDRLARRGEIAKWRGFWNTMSPRFGLGPLKTCFGPASLIGDLRTSEAAS